MFILFVYFLLFTHEIKLTKVKLSGIGVEKQLELF